jgi:hypothetical protein
MKILNILITIKRKKENNNKNKKIKMTAAKTTTIIRSIKIKSMMILIRRII